MSKVRLTHPQHEERFTPMTPQVVELLERMRVECRYWTIVASKSNLRMKQLRNLRTGQRKAVSYSLLDRMCVGTGVGGVHEFEWYTADELIDMGVWEPVQHVVGRQRVRRARAQMSQSEDSS